MFSSGELLAEILLVIVGVVADDLALFIDVIAAVALFDIGLAVFEIVGEGPFERYDHFPLLVNPTVQPVFIDKPQSFLQVAKGVVFWLQDEVAVPVDQTFVCPFVNLIVFTVSLPYSTILRIEKDFPTLVFQPIEVVFFKDHGLRFLRHLTVGGLAGKGIRIGYCSVFAGGHHPKSAYHSAHQQYSFRINHSISLKRMRQVWVNQSSFFAFGTQKITVRAPTAPVTGTMIRATEPAGMKTKVESSTMTVITPTALAFCVAVMPPRRW